MSGAFNRLGPRAQGALRRTTATAMTAAAGRRIGAEELDRQFRYALDLIETAMILDAAEAEAAAQDPH